MPPYKFKPPLPIRLKAPKGRIVPIDRPDVLIGKSIVANSPHRVTAEQLEEATKCLKKKLGKNREFFVRVFATYPVTKKPEGTKQGQGKGDIDRFVARVPAGRALFHIPTVNPFDHISNLPQFHPFKTSIGGLPMSCHFRSQNNQIYSNSLQHLTSVKQQVEKDNIQMLRYNKLHNLPLPPTGLENVCTE